MYRQSPMYPGGAMSRVQLALNVADLDDAIAFYSKLFGTAPAKVRPGYANFAVTEPPLKLILIAGNGEGGTLNHLGVEVESTDQVAAGWLNRLAGDRVDVFSGGSEPASTVNPAAVEAMAEVGIDIRTEFPKPWTDEIIRAADVVITMGCGDACPVYPGKRYEDWVLDDPEGLGVDAVRPIRDDIRRRVEKLI